MRKRSFLVCWLVLLIIISFTIPTNAFALKAGFDGVSNYSHWWYPNCSYGDRAGAQYVNNLYNAIKSSFSLGFKYTDYDANESHLRTDSIVNSVQFYAFSGHGKSWTYENGAHFYARSTGECWHDSSMENYDSVNARTNEVRLGHSPGYCLWATFYSCHWLRNDGNTTKQQNIFKMFEGATLQMGFASVMYLDSREGTAYGNNLVGGDKIIDAFLKAARIYQKQRKDGDSIARVVGYTAAKDDTIRSYCPALPSSKWYKNAPSLYSVIKTEPIPHNGIPIP